MVSSLIFKDSSDDNFSTSVSSLGYSDTFISGTGDSRDIISDSGTKLISVSDVDDLTDEFDSFSDLIDIVSPLGSTIFGILFSLSSPDSEDEELLDDIDFVSGSLADSVIVSHTLLQTVLVPDNGINDLTSSFSTFLLRGS